MKPSPLSYAFEKKDEIDWKQGNGILVGDTVFMYAAASISAILYKCSMNRAMTAGFPSGSLPIFCCKDVRIL